MTIHKIDLDAEYEDYLAKLAAACKPTAAAMINPLVGMFLHTFKGEEIHWQGRILSYGDGFFLVQLFSWLDGGPTNTEIMTIDDIKKCKIYHTDRLMNAAYLKQEQRLGRLVGSIEENMNVFDHSNRMSNAP